MKTFKIGILIILVAVVGFVVWYNASQKSDAPTTSKPLILGLNPWIGNGIYHIAKEKRFFNTEGVNVELQDYADGAVGKQLISSGKVDMLSLTPETVAILKDAGIDIKAVAFTDTSEGGDGIVATQNIKTVADLKGKKVAYEEGSPSHFFLSFLLDKQGMSTKDLQSVNVIAPDAGASFVSGNVDAAVTWQPWLSKASDRQGGHLITDSKENPILPALVIFRTQTVNERPQDIRAMLRAVFKAREWALANPNEANAIMAKAFGISVQDVKDQMPDFRWFSYQDNQSGFTSGAYSATNLIQSAGDLWLKLGLIKTKINASQLVDTSILKNLQ